MRKFSFLLTLIFFIYICSGFARADINFSVNFDDSLDAQNAAGDATAYTDGTMPSLVTGYGGSGKAIKNTYGTTLKYKTNNLNKEKDSISFKFQLPFETKEGLDKGHIGESYSPIDVSDTTGYTYIADYTADQIIRTKIDGTGWERLGEYGTGGDGKLNLCWGGDVSVDSRDETIYISDSCNQRIIKSKIDGSGWTSYDIPSSYNLSVINFDEASNDLYFYDRIGKQIVKTRFGSNEFLSVSLSAITSAITDFYFDSSSGFIYFLDPYASSLDRIKMDGTDFASYGTDGSGVGQFSNPYAIDFDGTYFYIIDEDNHRIVKTQFDGTGWQTFGTSGTGTGKFYDPTNLSYDQSTGLIYVLDSPDRYTNNELLIRTKIDGSEWQAFATQGVGNINDFDSMVYDNNTGYYYFAAAYNQVIRTKKDGTDWTIIGAHGDGASPFSFGYITGIDIDKTTGEVYALDHYADQVSKFKMDKSQWETWKGPEPGNGLDFSVPRGLSIDQETKEVYVADMDHNRIVKTKIDGSEWETYGTIGSGIGQFSHPMNIHYDPITKYVYVSDDGNPRIVRFKMDGGDPMWEELDTAAYSNWGLGFVVQDGSDYIYFSDYANNRIIKTKIDGTDQSYIDCSSWGSEKDLYNGMTPVYYDSSSSSLFFTNYRSIYRTNISGELIEKINATPNKVLLKTSGEKPMEIGISAYSGKFSLTLNNYQLPISYSQAQTLTAGTWHSLQINYDRSAGTMNAYLDGSDTPFISQSGMNSQFLKAMAEIGEYFYVGSDPDDPNRTFPGAIDDLTFGTPSAPAVSTTPTATSSPITSSISNLEILPETGFSKK